MRTFAKIIVTAAIAAALASGTATAAFADPVGSVPTPQKCLPLIRVCV